MPHTPFCLLFLASATVATSSALSVDPSFNPFLLTLHGGLQLDVQLQPLPPAPTPPIVTRCFKILPTSLENRTQLGGLPSNFPFARLPLSTPKKLPLSLSHLSRVTTRSPTATIISISSIRICMVPAVSFGSREMMVGGRWMW